MSDELKVLRDSVAGVNTAEGGLEKVLIGGGDRIQYAMASFFLPQFMKRVDLLPDMSYIMLT